MLLIGILILTPWVTVVALVLCACQMAARGDRFALQSTVPAGHGSLVAEGLALWEREPAGPQGRVAARSAFPV